MNQEREMEPASVVRCAWCGATIRDERDEETNGVCLMCFYQILSNHLLAQKRTVYGEFVSDR